jgi:hypothetical protein
MNMNVQRIDNGAKLTEAELDAFIQASWPARRATAPQPMCAEASTDQGADDPLEPPPREAMGTADLIALVALTFACLAIVVTAARGLYQLFKAGLSYL